jgi:hypothetical protein
MSVETYRHEPGALVTSRHWGTPDDDTGIIVAVRPNETGEEYRVHWSKPSTDPVDMWYSWTDLAPLADPERDVWRELVNSWLEYTITRMELIQEEHHEELNARNREWEKLKTEVSESLDQYERLEYATEEAMHWDGGWWNALSAPLRVEYKRAYDAERRLAAFCVTLPLED